MGLRVHRGAEISTELLLSSGQSSSPGVGPLSLSDVTTVKRSDRIGSTVEISAIRSSSFSRSSFSSARPSLSLFKRSSKSRSQVPLRLPPLGMLGCDAPSSPLSLPSAGSLESASPDGFAEPSSSGAVVQPYCPT